MISRRWPVDSAAPMTVLVQHEVAILSLGPGETLGFLCDGPASFDRGVVEDVLKGEQERCGEHRLGDLGGDA